MLLDCPKNEQLAEKQSFEGNCEIFSEQIFQFSSKRVNSLSCNNQVCYNIAPLCTIMP